MARILLVDDDRSVLKSFRYLLRMRNHEVVTASDGAEALPLLESNHFDLMVTDLKMQRIHGDELCRRAKEKFPDLPIIMVTGSQVTETCQADYVLSKGCDPAEFLDHVDRLAKK